MYKRFLLSLSLITSLFAITPVYAENLKLASWNIAWLGSHKFNQRTEKDYKELARYARQLDADVIALQEVENSDYARKVFGDDYDYYFSTKNWVQRVGVAVRKSKGYQVSSVEYKALDVGRVRYGMDITLSKNDEKLRLLAVHLKSGCFEKALDGKSVGAMANSTKNAKKNKRACEKLSKQIKPLESWIDQRAQENIPFIVIGDFNRRFSKDIELAHSEEAGLWQAIDDEGSEDMWAPTLDKDSQCWGGYYKDYIDHIVFDPKARQRYVQGSFYQLVFDGKYSKKLSRALSDHCPISIQLEL
ncbi:endonuclease/exonuclease/phosphatase family protein [Thalassotalea sp. G2M2-11]|uniref:endonuclease/exonuclease/phosphatase family protein n=1 Tax=Thalassotalea sp. G2M2-11 TaxID=2787627 RepID=UPI0019D05239|nr:endonuclease/exonuclease/phosphatase family protein [Thalassotalea sp. G2M2-11]